MIKEVVIAIPIDEVIEAGVSKTGAVLGEFLTKSARYDFSKSLREIYVRALGVADEVMKARPEQQIAGARAIYYCDDASSGVSLGVNEKLSRATGVPKFESFSPFQILTESALAHSLSQMARRIIYDYDNHFDDEAERVLADLRAAVENSFATATATAEGR